MTLDFNYTFPENFKGLFGIYAKAMGLSSLIEPLCRCKIKEHDLGFAYYAGVSGPYWNYHAIDVDIFGSQQDLDIIEKEKRRFVAAFDKALDPETTGLVSREFLFIPNSQANDFMDCPTSINLPDESDPMLKTLSFDIY